MVKRAAGLLERGLRVEAVRIEDIDIVETHALQALVAGGDQIFAAAPLAIGTRPHVVACLGGDDQLVAVWFEVLAEQLAEGSFGGAVGRAVIVGEVEMGDAEIEGGLAHLALECVGVVSPNVCQRPKEIAGSLRPERPQRVYVIVS